MNDAQTNIGYIVNAVAPDSPAFNAGIKSGDRIISINGIPVATTFDYINAMKNRGSSVVMEVIRNKIEVLTFTLHYEENPDYCFLPKGLAEDLEAAQKIAAATNS